MNVGDLVEHKWLVSTGIGIVKAELFFNRNSVRVFWFGKNRVSVHKSSNLEVICK